LAKETGRSEEFERPSTPVTIFYKKLPHLADRWAEQKAKQNMKTGKNQTFQNFME
jgi:ribosomal protein S12 methylthiotransferase accessory factor YcaO